MMLDTATTKCENAMTKLDKIREEQKSLETTTHKLLDEVLPSTEVAAKKRKSQAEDYKKGQKKPKRVIKDIKQSVSFLSVIFIFMSHLCF